MNMFIRSHFRFKVEAEKAKVVLRAARPWCMNTPLVDFVVVYSRCDGLMTVFQE